MEPENVYVPRDTVEIYQDSAGEYRWRRLSAGNHQVIATSGEGYVREDHCTEMAVRCNGTGVHLVHVGGTVTG
jgi:uncharacterized protein YegP (UPF0339 family)